MKEILKLQIENIEIYFEENKCYYSNAIITLIMIYKAKIHNVRSDNIFIEPLIKTLSNLSCNTKNDEKIYNILSENFVSQFEFFKFHRSEIRTLTNLLDIQLINPDTVPELRYKKGANKEEYDNALRDNNQKHLIKEEDTSENSNAEDIYFTEHEKEILEDYKENADGIKKNIIQTNEHNEMLKGNIELIENAFKTINEITIDINKHTKFITSNFERIKSHDSDIKTNATGTEKNKRNIETNIKKTEEHDELIAILGKVLEENSASDNQNMGWIKNKIDQIEQNGIYSDEIVEKQTRRSHEVDKYLSQAEAFLGKAAKTGLYNVQSEAFESFETNHKNKAFWYKCILVVSIIIYAVCAFFMIDHITSSLPSITGKNPDIFSTTDIIYLLKWSLPSIIITTLLFQFLGLMKQEMMTAQVMMEAYRHKKSMIMSSIGFKSFFADSKNSEELILSEMIKALAHNPTDDLKLLQNAKQDMPIDKAFGVIDKGLDKIVSVKDKIDKSFNRKPNTPNGTDNNT